MGWREFFRRAAAEPIHVPPPKNIIRKSYVDEIKDGGLKGAFGLDQTDWGVEIGSIWEPWRPGPCLGEPPNCDSGTICCATWYCCSVCALANLYAASLEQRCSLIPHFVFSCFCPFCTLAFLRYNLRYYKDVDGNLLGDFVCVLGCCPCAFLQHLRAVQMTDWEVSPTSCPRPMASSPKLIV